MDCAHCKRRIAECICPKEFINGKWPTNTWFQKRFKKVLIAQTNGHEPERESITRDTGYSMLDVLCFMAIMGLIVMGLFTFSVFARQVFQNLQSVERCIQALLECVTI